MRFVFKGSDATVSLTGELTFVDHQAFREVADRLGASTGKTIVIELADLEFIDSAGLGMLLIAREEARKTNRTLVLRGAKGQVGRMFALTKFDTLFSVEA
ncbi:MULTISPECIES: STAS domain-containing protein [Rhodopseudomonas]|uniref:Anti-sigma factor antagonist n=1 Tax=Rhodopseudomonas palustris TaxID=1076 RepID=A0A0D7F758_RHOPL|nr:MULTISPECIES: STAS domain-containing protein [Rhodopseudomonas]KIZ47552.1 anti-sigma factor antagonist [Rhodopseudomonas palustris]MDF3809605.1 STAS domain-containing protein [Rhodopseudomonas sp. BAL398]WOK17800.1 STAS domain-containing protein [Rhodopseudomonas sp. BAL398]